MRHWIPAFAGREQDGDHPRHPGLDPGSAAGVFVIRSERFRQIPDQVRDGGMSIASPPREIAAIGRGFGLADGGEDG